MTLFANVRERPEPRLLWTSRRASPAFGGHRNCTSAHREESHGSFEIACLVVRQRENPAMPVRLESSSVLDLVGGLCGVRERVFGCPAGRTSRRDDWTATGGADRAVAQRLDGE